MIPRVATQIGVEDLLSALLDSAGRGDETVAEFERGFAHYIGARKVFSTNSGRTALYLALVSLGLRPGESVVVPAYTCPIVFEVVLRLGLRLTLADIHPETYNIDPELVEEAIAPGTRAIVPIHLFGRPCPMDQIIETAQRHGLFVIEDSAQALGAQYKGKKTGILGDLAVFSFGPGKGLTSGEGGALVVNDPELEDKVARHQANLPEPDLRWNLRVLKNVVGMKALSNHCLYALVRDYLETQLAITDQETMLNCHRLTTSVSARAGTAEWSPSHITTMSLARMPPTAAKIVTLQLGKIDEIIQRRQTNARVLTQLIGPVTDRVLLPRPDPGVRNVFTRYPVGLQATTRDEVERGLLHEGIDVEVPYRRLAAFFRHLGKRYMHAEKACRSVMTIPVHACLSLRDVHKIGGSFVKVTEESIVDEDT